MNSYGVPEGQGKGAGIRDAKGRGREWESELSLGRTLLGSIPCILHLLKEFNNREMGDPSSWRLGVG